MDRYAAPDGVTLAFSDEGDGPGAPILCLAGLTRNMTDFDYFVETLDRPRRIIRLDSRGRGLSDYDPNYHNYNVLKEAEDARGLLLHLGIERVIVVGSSRGGVLGMVMAAQWPELLAGLVLNDVGPDVDYAGLRRILNFIGKPPGFATYEEAAADYEAKLGQIYTGKTRDYFREIVRRSYNEGPKGLELNYDAALKDATSAQLEIVKTHGHGLWPIFPALKGVPTLALRAENSDILSEDTVARMTSVKPDLTTVLVPGVGHTPRLNEPEALSAIRAFLDELGDG